MDRTGFSFRGWGLKRRENSAFPGTFAELSEGSVRYELSGPADGPVVVLVPGLSVPFEIWNRNAAELARAGFRVLRYDLYGRGFSGRTRKQGSLDLFVRQLEELVVALGLRLPLAVVGFSMGGPIAAAAALKPGLVRAVALVDPLVQWRKPTGVAALLRVPLLGDAIMALAGGRLLVDAQVGDFFDREQFEQFRPFYLPQLGFPGFPRSVLSSIRSMPSWPLRANYGELGRLDLPVLLVWGKEDRTVPFRDAHSLQAILPGSLLVEIDGAGHAPHWEKSEIVNEAIVSFLR